jgi:hypothetical protein
MYKVSNLQLLILFCLLLASCNTLTSSNTTKEDTFLKMLAGNCTMNSEIQFLPVQAGFMNKDDIWLDIKNNSQEPIIFPPDANVKLLTFNADTEQWVEIENEMNYIASPEPYFIIRPSSDGLPIPSSFSVLPVLEGNSSIELRVVVTGNIYKNNLPSNDCVSAFIDINVLP